MNVDVAFRMPVRILHDASKRSERSKDFKLVGVDKEFEGHRRSHGLTQDAPELRRDPLRRECLELHTSTQFYEPGIDARLEARSQSSDPQDPKRVGAEGLLRDL